MKFSDLATDIDRAGCGEPGANPSQLVGPFAYAQTSKYLARWRVPGELLIRDTVLEAYYRISPEYLE